MNKTQLSAVGFLLFYLINSQTFAEQADGVIRIKSMHSVTDTVDRLESALKNRGMTIFKRVSHSDGAAKVGLGTPLMQCQQLAALDLPQKALVYEDENGQVWYAYNDPEYIAYRHNVAGCEDVISKISKALFNFSRLATQ